MQNPEIIKLRAVEAWANGAKVPDTLLVPDGNSATQFILPLSQPGATTPTPGGN